MDIKYLFRAKKKEMKPENEYYCPNGWVFGETLFTATSEEEPYEDEAFLLPLGISSEAYYKQPYNFRANSDMFEVMLSKVDRSTICRYTNKNDVEKMPIFAGDIIEGTLSSQWRKCKIKCIVVDRGSCFECVRIESPENGCKENHKLMFAKDIRVIGNVWDNPELLGETNG